jgi:hypothetical protein
MTLSPRHRAVYEIMWIKRDNAGQATDDNTTRRMRCACWITKATDPYTEICNSYCFFTATMVM